MTTVANEYDEGWISKQRLNSFPRPFWQDLFVCTIIIYPVKVTMQFDLFIENFNFANNFWTMQDLN